MFTLFLEMSHPDGHQIIDGATSYFAWLIVTPRSIILAQLSGQIDVLIYRNHLSFARCCMPMGFCKPLAHPDGNFNFFTYLLLSCII